MPCSPATLLPGAELPVAAISRPTGKDLFTGLRIYELDTGRELEHDGGGWVIMSEPAQTFTSILTQTATIAATVTFASFKRSNGWCDANYYATITGTSISGSDINIVPTGLPAPLVSGSQLQPQTSGTFQYVDQGTAFYVGSAFWQGARIMFQAHNVLQRLGTTPSFMAAPTDILSFTLRYQMATRYS